MNNKIVCLSVLLFSSISLLGCQRKVIYATSQITGQIIDKQTNMPIEGVKTIINSQALDFTDKQGRFTVPPVTYEYTANASDYREVVSRRGSSFDIYKSGYEIKSYANGGLASIPRAYTEKGYIDMGQVYLNPVPVGQEGEYETYYLTLNFCKPTQSQKEVDCIPVPEGKTYEQVSPNQLVR